MAHISNMDTRFWGPGAWRLLHTITFSSDADPATLAAFFETLPYVLPCKYCRASLTDYYREDPIRTESREAMQEWLYRIHNRVNGKLRSQGLMATRNPTFAAVKKMYAAAGELTAAAFPAWDFLYSVSFNHPLSVKGSTPMSGAPGSVAATDHEELNLWNLLPSGTRYMYWRRFWELLPAALPAVWRDAWIRAAGSTQAASSEAQGTARAAVHWLWAIRCKFDRTSKDPYREVCSRLAAHSSGCSKSTRSKTCRKKRPAK